MTLDFDICYEALRARDARFDGAFFVGVKTTGIYCRAVCPARTPRRSSCWFFRTSAEAERNRFRPCLRCRPELAPRQNMSQYPMAHEILRFLQRHATEIDSVEEAAKRTGFSSRQMRRILDMEFGVSPLDVIHTERLLFAKKLLHDTSLSIAEIAYSSGFNSVRRFNALFQDRYKSSPSLFRRGKSAKTSEDIQLRLAYRPPLAWEQVIKHLEERSIAGVERVNKETFIRAVALDAYTGWVSVRPAQERNFLHVQVANSLSPMLFQITTRLRGLFDLDSNPSLIADHFLKDPTLAHLVKAMPGLRVVGSWDPFELAVRAVLGQQISVSGARTLAGRFVERFGAKVETPFNGISRAFPTPSVVADASPEDIAALGITKLRAETLFALARFAAGGELHAITRGNINDVLASLREIKGIGEWTIQYIALRAFRFPDAFPAGDLGLRKAAGKGTLISEQKLLDMAEFWRPWRSYAATYLWQMREW